MSEVLSFRAKEWVHIKGRGWVAVIHALTDIEQETKKLYVGGPVRIDLNDYIVRGVERFAVIHWHRLDFGIMIDGEPKGIGVPINAVPQEPTHE